MYVPKRQQETVQEQERLRLEAERAAQAERKAKEDAVVREGVKLMQVGERSTVHDYRAKKHEISSCEVVRDGAANTLC